jgi:hypothetical protein
MESAREDLILLLQSMNRADSAAEATLTTIVYDELGRPTACAGSGRDHTLQAKALMREDAWAKNVAQEAPNCLSMKFFRSFTEAHSTELVAVDAALDRSASMDAPQPVSRSFAYWVA